MKLRNKTGLALALLLPHLSVFLLAQAKPNVPPQYQRLFCQYADRRQFYEKALNSVGLTTLPIGRGYALIAGVTQYPNFAREDQDLKPAAVDIEKLKSYLKDQEFFDEIVVLKDGDMNLDNLNYFLQVYFPERLKSSPHARFLFAYSGHGYAEGASDTARGFLLTSPAVSKTDPVNRIDLSLLRTLLDPDILSAEKVLVLINACQSGAFLGRKPFGASPIGPGDRGAHAIMASRSNQQSLQLSTVGPGSVFFEKIFAGLEGAADKSPPDGIVTYHELDAYLLSEIPYATNGTQIPMDGDISPNGSVGEFFFLNRSRQVQVKNAKPWNPGSASAFGNAAADAFERGNTAYLDRRYDEAFRLFLEAAKAGNADAMSYVASMYDNGMGGVSQNSEQALQWYEKGAAAGSTDAMLNLGKKYSEGYHVTRNVQQGIQWYEKGAAAGNAMAMYNLGYMYEHGEGTLDYQQARNWYEKSAAAGEAIAMYRLGGMYEHGEGTQDLQQARQWYQKAADAGVISASERLKQLPQ